MPRRSKDATEPPEETVGVTVRFPVTLRKRALVIAQAEYRTFNSLVIWALGRYVAERESQEAEAPGGK